MQARAVRDEREPLIAVGTPEAQDTEGGQTWRTR